VVVAPRLYLERARRMIRRAGIPNISTVIPGGRTRQDSVRLGLRALSIAPHMVLVHDAARPLVTASLIRRLLRSAARATAVVPALPVTDTLKQVRRGRTVGRTVSRDGLWTVQTPQVFDYELLCRAHRRVRAARMAATDDAALVERLGAPVLLVPGSRRNIKITRRGDMRIAEMWLKNPELGS